MWHAEQVGVVHHAPDVVDAIANDGEACMSRICDDRQHLCDALIFDKDNLRAWRHHISRRALAELNRSRHQLGGLRVNLSFIARARDDGTEFLRGSGTGNLFLRGEAEPF